MIKFEHPRITRNKLSAKEIWSLTIIPEDVNLKKIAIAEFGSSEALNLLAKVRLCILLINQKTIIKFWKK